MEASEYDNLERVERDSWYYAGKRELVHGWLARTGQLRPEATLLDCGAGTGHFAEEMAAHCRVLVLDDHEESLRRLRARFRGDQVLTLVDGELPLRPASVEMVTALDVLEHVPDDAAVVRGFHRVLKPGGAAVVTVPASMALWSDWDVSLHHYRRYRRAQLRALFPSDSWTVEYVNYTNVVVYPAVWAVRKWRGLRHKLGWKNDGARTEDHLPPPWLNDTLREIFVGLARSRFPFPIGVSLILVAKKK